MTIAWKELNGDYTTERKYKENVKKNSCKTQHVAYIAFKGRHNKGNAYSRIIVSTSVKMQDICEVNERKKKQT